MLSKAARLINEVSAIYRKIPIWLSSFPRLRILLSLKKDWIADIQKGFRGTGHRLTFDVISLENCSKYDLVIPLTVPDLLHVSGSLPDNLIPIPSVEAITLCDDKSLFNETLLASRFAPYIPRINTRQYPYVLKKRKDEWGQHCFIIHNEKEEERFTSLLENEDYFTQEFVGGNTEYTTHLLIQKGEMVSALTIKYLFDMVDRVKGKDPWKMALISSSPYVALFADILRYIGFEGLCCVNYKVRDRQPYILEVNPRCGGSLTLFLFYFVEQALRYNEKRVALGV